MPLGEAAAMIDQSIAEELADALREIVGATVEPDDEPQAMMVSIRDRALEALVAYEEAIK